jgi:ABC-2 type transport system permease protein
MPPVLEAISNVLPLSYATDAMQHLVRYTTTAEVWRDLAVVAAFAVGALVLGAATLRRRTP